MAKQYHGGKWLSKPRPISHVILLSPSVWRFHILRLTRLRVKNGDDRAVTLFLTSIWSHLWSPNHISLVIYAITSSNAIMWLYKGVDMLDIPLIVRMHHQQIQYHWLRNLHLKKNKKMLLDSGKPYSPWQQYHFSYLVKAELCIYSRTSL